jgi:hypothetical protein
MSTTKIGSYKTPRGVLMAAQHRCAIQSWARERAAERGWAPPCLPADYVPYLLRYAAECVREAEQMEAAVEDGDGSAAYDTEYAAEVLSYWKQAAEARRFALELIRLGAAYKELDWSAPVAAPGVAAEASRAAPVRERP